MDGASHIFTAVCLDDNGNECAPVLNKWNGKRKLNLNQLVGDWNDNYRFPAVRK